jgi:hypothetical protein
MRKTMMAMVLVPLIVAPWARAQAVPGVPSGSVPGGCGPGASLRACEYAAEAQARTASRSVTAEQAGAGQSGGGVVLRFKDVEGDTTALDVGEVGASPGDTLFFDNLLRDSSGRESVGRFVSRCTQVTASAHHCQGTLLLGGSQLDLATTTKFGDPAGIIASVVGGTGQYAGAGGEARITPTATSGTSRLVVRLLDR